MVERRYTIRQRDTGVLQSYGYYNVDPYKRHWHFPHCDLTEARNAVPVLCQDQQLRKNFDVSKYYSYDRFDELPLLCSCALP